MNCQSIELLIPEYLKGTMSEEEKGGFEGHIQSCPTCREELNQMQTLWAGIKAGSQVQPGSHLRPRFYAMLDAYKHAYHAKEGKPGLWVRIETLIQNWWPKRPAIQAAFSFALLIVGVLIGIAINGNRVQNSELTRLHNSLQSMQQTVSLSMLNQSSSADRLQAIHLSTQIRQPGEDLIAALLQTLNEDSNINVRLAALDALYLFGDQLEVREALIQSLNTQKSPLLQIGVINLLTSLQERRALDALRWLVQDQEANPSVKEVAQSLIDDLT